jgi:hypothetical protein
MVLLVGMVSIFGCGWMLFKITNRWKKIKREIKVKKDIHNKLISLIEDQRTRVKSYDAMSQVALATIEIRVRRLDRTDTKI